MVVAVHVNRQQAAWWPFQPPRGWRVQTAGSGGTACCDRIKALGLFLLVASAAPVLAQTDIHGTWTAEIRQGEGLSASPERPRRPTGTARANGNGDWNMGQSFPGRSSWPDCPPTTSA